MQQDDFVAVVADSRARIEMLEQGFTRPPCALILTSRVHWTHSLTLRGRCLRINTMRMGIDIDH